MPEDTPVRVRINRLAPDPDVFVRTLSLAVEVRDVATGTVPVGNVVVTVDGLTEPARITEAGVHLFVDADLPDPPVTVTVDAGERYFEVTASVSKADLDASLPATTVTLVPTPAYDFPPSLTVVRGFIRTPPPTDLGRPETPDERAARGVEGAALSVRRAEDGPPIDGLDFTITTDATGEFAIPIPLGGAVETVTETFTETIDPGDGTGTPRTREAYRQWVAIDGTDPVLSVEHADITPDATGATVATVPLHVEPQTTSQLALELDGGTVEAIT